MNLRISGQTGCYLFILLFGLVFVVLGILGFFGVVEWRQGRFAHELPSAQAINPAPIDTHPYLPTVVGLFFALLGLYGLIRSRR